MTAVITPLVTAIASALGRRDRELERREWYLGGIALGPDEYQVFVHAKVGPFKLYANACECGERDLTLYLDLPAPAHEARRVVVDWWAGERPKVMYQHFTRPTPFMRLVERVKPLA